jgi:hypothetical protein
MDALGLAVQAGAHVGHLMDKLQAVVQAPGEKHMVARRHQDTLPAYFRRPPISAIMSSLVSLTAWPK